MYTIDELDKEIDGKIAWLQERNGQVASPEWITTAVLHDHPDVEGADADFYLCCSRNSIRSQVRRRLNRFRVESNEPSNQLELEGFNRLQQYYLVARDGEQQAVRIDSLTDREIDEKVRELLQMAAGCQQHVDELLRYRSRRQAGLLAFA